MKKQIALFCLVFAVMLAGCAAIPETPTSSPTDKATGTEYSYTTTRKLSTQQPTLEQMQARCIARTSADTDTLKIELAGR